MAKPIVVELGKNARNKWRKHGRVPKVLQDQGIDMSYKEFTEKHVILPKKHQPEQTELGFTDYSKQDDRKHGTMLFPPANCETAITDHCDFTKNSNYVSIEFLWRNLASLHYVLRSLNNFIFSDQLTVLNENREGDKAKLHKFLKDKNISDVSNETVLRSAVMYMFLYGQAGVRLLSEGDGLVYVPYDQFAVVEYEDEKYKGVNRVFGYVVARYPHVTAGSDSTFGNLLNRIKSGTFTREELEELEEMLSDDENFILVPPTKFINLRTDTTKIDGDPMLFHDRQSIQLLVSSTDKIIKDLENEGFGRVLLYMKNNLFAQSDGADEITGGDLLKLSSGGFNDVIANVKNEVEAFSTKLVHSSADSVVPMPTSVDKHELLEKKLNAIEFLEYTRTSTETVAQIFGIPPALLGAGNLSGNVSMGALLDTAMKNSIIPYRTLISSQLGNISLLLGIGEIEFDAYETKYVQEEVDYFKTVAETADLLLRRENESMRQMAEEYVREKFNIYKGE